MAVSAQHEAGGACTALIVRERVKEGGCLLTGATTLFSRGPRRRLLARSESDRDRRRSKEGRARGFLVATTIFSTERMRTTLTGVLLAAALVARVAAQDNSLTLWYPVGWGLGPAAVAY